MKRHDLTKEEIVRRGQEIYEREIRAKVEREHDGEFIVVDVTTGSYEVDESDVAASDRALEKNPDAVLCFLRVNRPPRTGSEAHAYHEIPTTRRDVRRLHLRRSGGGAPGDGDKRFEKLGDASLRALGM